MKRYMLRFKRITPLNNENGPKRENPKTRGRGHERVLEYRGKQSPCTRTKNILKSVILIHVYLLTVTRALYINQDIL